MYKPLYIVIQTQILLGLCYTVLREEINNFRYDSNPTPTDSDAGSDAGSSEEKKKKEKKTKKTKTIVCIQNKYNM